MDITLNSCSETFLLICLEIQTYEVSDCLFALAKDINMNAYIMSQVVTKKNGTLVECVYVGLFYFYNEIFSLNLVTIN